MHSRQLRIEPGRKRFGFRRRRFLDRRDLQHPLVERDIQAVLCLLLDCRKPLVEERFAPGDEAFEVGIDGDWPSAIRLQFKQGPQRIRPSSNER